MKTRLTLFTGELVLDSPLSVSGLDRESSADTSFTIVDGQPTLVGRGLKGAAVAMARRFFEPLPRFVSEEIKNRSLIRSAWEFSDISTESVPRLRAGVGIRQKTGARAKGVLFDLEVVPAGTKWPMTIRVDWSQTRSDAESAEAEGILGYVLAEHWAKGRCWLGGGQSRGLGWCHLDHLRAYRLDDSQYEVWVKSGRKHLNKALSSVPTCQPTRSWSFRTLDLKVSFGEYRPDPTDAPWGLDMMSVGPHDSERQIQSTGDGEWARPSWATGQRKPEEIVTDRALLMDRGKPVLPGGSLRGPLRHAFSRAKRAAGETIIDPHTVNGHVGYEDLAAQTFGSVSQSSRILIRDARAEGAWYAAKLHMHAEDEFSAGSYGSAKRDAVRLLRGDFPVQIVVEGPDAATVDPLVNEIDELVKLGALGHLPIGGHKTRGAGWGRWHAQPWKSINVTKERESPKWAEYEDERKPSDRHRPGNDENPITEAVPAALLAQAGRLQDDALTLGLAAKHAQAALSEKLVAWWCEPSPDLDRKSPAPTFGRAWPDDDEHSALKVDEVSFFTPTAVWRAVRQADGNRYVHLSEVVQAVAEAKSVQRFDRPARLHNFDRFSARRTGASRVTLREWREGDELLGYTLCEETKP